MSHRLGVDVGGTFTDLVLFDESRGSLRVAKTPSTPHNQAIGVAEGIAKICADALTSPDDIHFLIHGTTVATNALLERRGVTCALITTEGFRDVLQIGRQDRPHLYDAFVRRPEPIVPRHLRFEAHERMLHTGEVLTPLDETKVRSVVRQIRQLGAVAIAVCLLHAYANPAHERRIGEIIAEEYPEAIVTLSHEILAEFKEFERMSTTVVNAYVMPIVKSYLDSLQERMADMGIPSELHIMQSNGGLMTGRTASAKSVHTILSGLAAGAVGAQSVARLADADSFISVDMGGTSFDICLCHKGRIALTREGEIASLPVRVPMMDIHTLGAGGGSIAWIDSGGALRVGPQSAGAEPGPACYAQDGQEATVTDANLVLGRLNPAFFVGGEIPLEIELARQAIERRIARPLGLSIEAAAEGIVRVINATMTKGMRFVSVERGYDPRQFALIAFGGSGPVHATALAAELGMPRVIIPVAPGVTSALGLLVADFRHDYSRTLLRSIPGMDMPELNLAYTALEAEGLAQMLVEGVDPSAVVFTRSADLRYLGQGYELEVHVPPGLLTRQELRLVSERFVEAHRREYGYVKEENETVELVNLRVAAVGSLPKPTFDAKPISPRATVNPARALKNTRLVFFEGSFCPTPIYDRALLEVGDEVEGPAIVEQLDSTTVLPPGLVAGVDPYNNLVIDLHAHC